MIQTFQLWKSFSVGSDTNDVGWVSYTQVLLNATYTLLDRIWQGIECRSIIDVKDKSKAHLMTCNSLTLTKKEKKQKTAYDLPSKYNTSLWKYCHSNFYHLFPVLFLFIWCQICYESLIKQFDKNKLWPKQSLWGLNMPV